MGLIRKQKEGQGMHIEGRGRSINVIILGIFGAKDNPYIALKVYGLPGCSGLEFLARHGYVKLVDGIKLRVSPDRWEGIRVRMDYKAPSDYKLNRIEDQETAKHYLGPLYEQLT